MPPGSLPRASATRSATTCTAESMELPARPLLSDPARISSRRRASRAHDSLNMKRYPAVLVLLLAAMGCKSSPRNTTPADGSGGMPDAGSAVDLGSDTDGESVADMAGAAQEDTTIDMAADPPPVASDAPPVTSDAGASCGQIGRASCR